MKKFIKLEGYDKKVRFIPIKKISHIYEDDNMCIHIVMDNMEDINTRTFIWEIEEELSRFLKKPWWRRIPNE